MSFLVSLNDQQKTWKRRTIYKPGRELISCIQPPLHLDSSQYQSVHIAVSLALYHILRHPLIHAGPFQISLPQLNDSSILHHEPEHSRIVPTLHLLDTLHRVHPHPGPGHHLLLPHSVHHLLFISHKALVVLPLCWWPGPCTPH